MPRSLSVRTFFALVALLAVMLFVALLSRHAHAAPLGPTVAHAALAPVTLADAAPVTVAGKAIVPAPLPDVTDVSGDVTLAKELAGAAKAKDYLLLVGLLLLVIVGVLKKLAGKVKALAFVDTHLGGVLLNFLCAAAAVAVGADRAGVHFSWSLLEVAGLAGLTAAGGWHAVVSPILAALFPAKPAAAGVKS